jgi:hypothetical protein
MQLQQLVTSNVIKRRRWGRCDPIGHHDSSLIQLRFDL